MEDPLDVGWSHTAPLIDDLDADAIDAGLTREPDGTALSVLDGIREEVGDDLIEPAAVPDAGTRRLRHDHQQRVLTLGFVGETLAHVANELREIHGFGFENEPSGGDVSDVEQRVDEPAQPVRLGQGLLDA